MLRVNRTQWFQILVLLTALSLAAIGNLQAADETPPPVEKETLGAPQITLADPAFFKKIDENSEAVSEAVVEKISEAAFKAADRSSVPRNYWFRGSRKAKVAQVKDRLKQSGRVRFVTTDQALDLCRKSFPKADCSQLHGFYVPALDKIYLVGTSALELANQEGISETFFHELMHAYQYSVRYGYDLYYLQQIPSLVKAGVRPKEFLAYIYEAQAHWYTFLAFEPKLWEPEKSEKKIGPTLAGTGKGLLSAVSFTIIPRVSKKFLDKYLPKFDQRVAHHDDGYLFYALEHTYVFNEPLLYRTKKGVWNPGVSVDFKFYRLFSESVERNYFGAETYQAGDEGQWVQILFRNMNDLYYGLEEPSNVKQWELMPCSDINPHSLMETRFAIPFHYWNERIAKPEFAACMNPKIKKLVRGAKRKTDVKVTFQQASFSNFWIRGDSHGGGEGSHPDLLIHPQFPLSPEKK
jgi:hypothetical protein